MPFNTGHNIPCCFERPDRIPGCHATCEKYKQQRAEYDAKRAEHKKKTDVQRGLSEYHYDGIHKTTRRRIYRGKYRKGH